MTGDSALILAAVAVGVATYIQGITGVGFGMVAMPLLVLIDPGTVPGPVIIAGIFASVPLLIAGWRQVAWRELGILLPGVVVGSLVAAIFIGLVSSSTLRSFVGLLLVVVGGTAAFSRPRAPGPVAFTSAGFATGFMGTVAGVHSAPLAILYRYDTLAKVRPTAAALFVAAYTLSLAGLAAIAPSQLGSPTIALAMIPGVVVGLYAASGRFARPADGIMRPIILMLCVFAGLRLIMSGMKGGILAGVTQ
ncbi:TSUP family transporter [Sphingomonas histidinilytica]|uniref:sulfite exporter TauE/SafE family protein n=1 Tax=Rhizorhabdus histidinilytica TaxID=439228 RepID=UPI001ADC89DB|nr:sulfite exporter TauE/SafE family protein [Rhizorhabdus histidinilytica]MBO9380465.1 TSUP family transporter [Rhizorhabdus histidinilytica]